MAHVVTNKCNGCKFTDCVGVCPVGCFYEMESQLVIDPEDCIDCTACVSECPVQAIYAEGDLPAAFQADLEFNATHATRLKDAGEQPLLQNRQPLETALQKKAELGY